MIAATDYVKTFADQIRAFVPGRYRVLGTDGYGRSDYRRNLRRFFEVDRHYVALAALTSLAEDGSDPGGPGGRRDRTVRHRPRQAGSVAGLSEGAGMATATEVSVPDLGDFADVPVIEIHVAPGDVVHNEDPLVTLESDKATMDIPSPAAGTVRELRVKVGDLVSRGSPILLLDTEGAAVEPPPLTDQQEPPALDAADPVAAAREPAAVRPLRPTEGGSGRRGRRDGGGRPRTSTACTPAPGCGGWPASWAWT